MEMTASDLKLYLALLHKAQRHTTVEPKADGEEIASLTGLSKNSLTKARGRLVDQLLISAKRGKGNAYSYGLRIPFSGEPMVNFHKRGTTAKGGNDYLSKLASKLFGLSTAQYERYYRNRLGDGEIRPTENGLSACCPFHDDQNPSLEVGLEKGQWYCRACRIGGLMIHFEQRIAGCEPDTALRNIASFLGLGQAQPQEEPIAKYDYCDENGVLLFQVLRLPDREGRKRFVARIEDLDAPGGYRFGIGETRRVLYQLPDVVRAQQVIVVEGEKDVGTLNDEQGFPSRDGGYVAVTTSPFGAGNWREEYAETLRGKDVVILPDSDEPGRAHADSVLHSLHGIAASARVVNLPQEEGIKDVTDYMQRHQWADLIDLIGGDWFGSTEGLTRDGYIEA